MAGIIEVKDQGKVRIYDADNSNYVDIVVPSTVSSNRTITIPDATFTIPTADTVFSASTIESNEGVIYTGNPQVLKEVCPGVFGTIKPVGYCMIGQK